MALRLAVGKDEHQVSQWVYIAPDGAGGYRWWTDEDAADPAFPSEWEAAARIRVARNGNVRMQQEMRKLTRQYARFRDRDGNLPLEIEERIFREVQARTVLLDWEGIALGDHGEPEPYTPELGAKALKADPAFQNVISAASMDAFKARTQALEEDIKALENFTAGPSPSDAM